MSPEELQANVERLLLEHQQLVQRLEQLDKALSDRIKTENRSVVNIRGALQEVIDGTNLAPPEKERLKLLIGADL